MSLRRAVVGVTRVAVAAVLVSACGPGSVSEGQPSASFVTANRSSTPTSGIGAARLLRTTSADKVPLEVSWSGPVELSDIGDGWVSQVVVSADGTRATAIWADTGGTGSVRSASAIIAGNIATWGAAQTVSDNAWSPRVGMSADGTRATMVWELEASDGDYQIQSASATISGTSADWGPASTLDLDEPGLYSEGPDVGVSADGTRATAVWCRRDEDGEVDLVQAASANIAGNISDWGAATTLARDCFGYDGGPQVRVSASGGRATAVWQGEDCGRPPRSSPRRPRHGARPRRSSALPAVPSALSSGCPRTGLGPPLSGSRALPASGQPPRSSPGTPRSGGRR